MPDYTVWFLLAGCMTRLHMEALVFGTPSRWLAAAGSREPGRQNQQSLHYKCPSSCKPNPVEQVCIHTSVCGGVIDAANTPVLVVA